MGSLVLLEVAATASTCANGLVTLALPWLVLERTGSPADAGLVSATVTLPLLAGALFAGTVVDLFGRRRTAVGSDLMSAMSVAAVPLADAALGFSLWWLAALAVLGSVFDLSGVTARKTMLPTAAARAGWSLEKANGVHESAKAFALMAGPGVGGLLIGFGGAVAPLWAAAVLSLLATLVQAGMRLPSPERHGEPAQGSPWRAVRRGAAEGLVMVWNDRLLRVVGLLGSVLFMIYLPISGIVLPAYFHEQGTPQRLGLLTVAMTVGGVVGALVYGFHGHRLPRRGLFTATMLTASAGLFAMSWLPPYPLLLTAAVVVGVAYGPISPLMNLATQLRSTERTRGRVMGIMTSCGYVAGPAGFLAGGPLVERLGPGTSFVLLASVLCVLVTGASLLPALREFNHLSDAHLSGVPPRAEGSGRAVDGPAPGGTPSRRPDVSPETD
ncbi:MFS transporter [Streptomyces sp. NRRL F-5135]|uniref:MFS transporter n=1 Tax=Streptomyces sp. NRRL F-5135 TaxID=1463858 RepID=UPI000A85F3D0|nr:MFS transporter [Streptomyces sp. NRRL F-5135]